MKQKRPILRTQYSERDQCGITFPQESKTRQEFKDETDINFIVRRYTETGYMPPPNTPGIYGVMPELDPLQRHLKVAAVKTAYEGLDPSIKAQMTIEQYLESLTSENTPEGQLTESDNSDLSDLSDSVSLTESPTDGEKVLDSST